MEFQKRNRSYFWLPWLGRCIEALVILSVICIMVLPMSYSGIQSYDLRLSVSRGYTDQEIYINTLDDIENGRWSSVKLNRLLTPYLASLIPSGAKVFFSHEQEFTESRLAAMKFTVVNMVFLFATAVILYIFQKLIGLNAVESIFGIIVYLAAPFIVRMAAIPNYDMTLHFFIGLGCLGILLKNPFLYFIGLGLGILSGEAVLMLIILALFIPYGWKERIRLIIPAFIALCIYMLFLNKSAIVRIDDSIFNKIVSIPLNICQMISVEGFFRVVAVKLLLLSFGVGWVPALWAMFNSRKSASLRRWWWLVPLVIAGMFGVHNYDPRFSFGVGRHFLAAFPLICPLAGIGIYDMLVRIEKRF